MARGHHRAAAACAPRCRAARARRQLRAGTHLAAAAQPDRSVPAVPPGHAGQVPHAHRGTTARHGARARLRGRTLALPLAHRRHASTSTRRGLPAPAHAAGRAGAGRLGSLRSSAHRPRPPPADGLRDGAQPLAHGLPALLPGRPDGQLPARPRPGLRRLRRRAPGAAVRQPQERGARAPGRRDPLQPRPAGTGRPLPLRAAPGGGGAR